jgi:CheY-like chemotaxis protein
VVAAVGNAEDLPSAVDDHDPDAAVVDLGMPPGYTDEGIRAAIAIRRDHPGPGVLVFSRYIETCDAANLLGAASGSAAAAPAAALFGGCERPSAPKWPCARPSAATTLRAMQPGC